MIERISLQPYGICFKYHSYFYLFEEVRDSPLQRRVNYTNMCVSFVYKILNVT